MGYTVDGMIEDAQNQNAAAGVVPQQRDSIDTYNRTGPPGWQNMGLYKGYDDMLWANVSRPSSYSYGGTRTGAADEESRYADLGATSNGRLGAQINNTNYDHDRDYDRFSRVNESYGLNKYRDAIEGRGPSVAENQMGLGLAQAQQQNANALQASQAAAASRAASSRGGGANLAAAQMQAAQIQGGQAAMANQTQAQLGQQAAYQGAMLRAQEQQQAMAGYSGLASNQRSQDLQREQISAGQAYNQAQLQQQQNALNDARQMGFEQMRQKVFEDQMQGQQAGEAANAGAFLGRANVEAQNRQTDYGSYWGLGGLFR